jgi:hypothetical protein
MLTAHRIVADFCAQQAIDMQDFWEWFRDNDHREDEANIHETRFLTLLQEYVAYRTEVDDCLLEISLNDMWTDFFDVIYSAGWQTIDDGLTERKVQIGEMMNNSQFYFRVEISYLGGDDGHVKAWHGPYPSREAAAIAADKSDAQYRSEVDDAANDRENIAIRFFL